MTSQKSAIDPYMTKVKLWTSHDRTSYLIPTDVAQSTGEYWAIKAGFKPCSTQL